MFIFILSSKSSADEFLPSIWNGNYTCADDSDMVPFVMNITKSSVTSIVLIGDMYINGSILVTSGSFASAFKQLTLQNFDVMDQDILHRNFSKVELNGLLKSPVFIDGVIIFTENNNRYNCPMELRRGPSKYIYLISSLNTCNTAFELTWA